MKGILKNIIAGVMLLIMAAISPMTDLSQSLHTGAATAKAAGETAKAAENAGGKYITEVRLGMGADKETAENYLTSNGFTVVKDGDNPFDLNWDAWKESSKEWRGEANVVLLGYKTTNDPTDAITDLAVMNMEGGYSVEDYNQILKDNMETKIRPFMERFITTLNEYRENLEKPKDSENFKRADYVRKLLNKMTDDDTDGSPIGDLLVNETKFELGDHEYNALSDSEKKKHADIITMFQQGDDIMIYLLGNLLARGADTSDNTWIDRLKGTTLDDLMEEVQAKSKSSGTKSDINAELDKKYEDKAKAVLSHWNELTEKLNDLSTAEQKVDEFDPDATQELKETLEDAADEDLTKEKIDELSDEIAEQFSDNADTVDAATTVSISEFLEKIDYDFDVAGNRGYTLLDFFKLEKADFSGDNIRYLYPIVDALSEGQLAGLDYLPIKDMILSVFSIESDADSSLKDVATISFYNAVNREIYEPGGVGLTSDARRKEAATKEVNQKKEGESASFYLTLVGGIVGALGVAGVAGASALLISGEWLADVPVRMAEVTVESLKKIAVAGAIVAVIGVAIVLIAQLWLGAKEDEEKYNITYKKIPKYMVDEVDIIAYNENGERIFIKNQTAYYKAALCNRSELVGSSDVEKKVYGEVGDMGDINGDNGSQWVALYAAKNGNGAPILADSFKCVCYEDTVPDGYSVGIHEFGSVAAFNMNKKPFVYNNKAPKLYVYYKTESLSADALAKLSATGKEPGAAGSIIAEDEGKGTGITPAGVALGGGIGIVLGALLGGLIMFFNRKKKLSDKVSDKVSDKA